MQHEKNKKMKKEKKSEELRCSFFFK